MVQELTLLRGRPIYVEGIGYIYPLTIAEIEEIGEDNFYILLSLLTFEQQKTGQRDWFTNPRHEDILLMSWALSSVLKEEVFFKEGTYRTAKGGELSCENYESLVEVIQKQYALKKSEPPSYANEKAKEIAMKMQKEKAKIKPSKQGLSLQDIISGVAAKHPSLNLFQIWNLTLYQLYDQFKRLQLIENYTFNLSAALQGAEVEKITHWSINKEDDN